MKVDWMNLMSVTYNTGQSDQQNMMWYIKKIFSTEKPPVPSFALNLMRNFNPAKLKVQHPFWSVYPIPILKACISFPALPHLKLWHRYNKDGHFLLKGWRSVWLYSDWMEKNQGEGLHDGCGRCQTLSSPAALQGLGSCWTLEQNEKHNVTCKFLGIYVMHGKC